MTLFGFYLNDLVIRSYPHFCMQVYFWKYQKHNAIQIQHTACCLKTVQLFEGQDFRLVLINMIIKIIFKRLITFSHLKRFGPTLE